MSRSFQVQCLMGALLVKLLAEGVELALLSRQIGSRGTRRLSLQGAMHALVSTVLLGFARLDELGQDSEPDPPGRQLGQPS